MDKKYVDEDHAKPKTIWGMLTFDRTNETIDYSLFRRAGKIKNELIGLIENNNKDFPHELLILEINNSKDDFIKLINICSEIECYSDKYLAIINNNIDDFQEYDFEILRRKMFALEESFFKYNNYLFSRENLNFSLSPKYIRFSLDYAGIPSSDNKFELIYLLNKYFQDKKIYYVDGINHCYNDIDNAKKKLDKSFSDLLSEYIFLDKEIYRIFSKIEGDSKAIESLNENNIEIIKRLEEILKRNPSSIYGVLNKFVDFIEGSEVNN